MLYICLVFFIWLGVKVVAELKGRRWEGLAGEMPHTVWSLKISVLYRQVLKRRLEPR